MSDFTIEQLEALKEGTTPGPWEVKDDHGGPNLFSPTGRLLRSDSCGDVSGDEDDVGLMAAAPSLVDALIAEKRAHQKLRAEIEGFLRICIESAESLELNAMTAYSTEAFESASFVERDTAAALARILEGE